MQPPAARRSPDPVRGLILLMLANVVGFLAWSWITTIFYATYLRLPFALTAMQQAIRQSQWQSYGIAAALIPERRLVGLAWALGLGLVNGLAHVSLNAISMSRGGGALPLDQWMLRISVPAYETVGVFTLMQAMRFMLGWRIAPAGQLCASQRGQFRIGDLMEWTVSVAVWLGLNQFIKVEAASFVHYFMAMAGAAVILIPVALAVTSQRGLRGITALALFAWIMSVESFFYAVGFALDPRAFAWPWATLLAATGGSLAGYLLATGINFAIIRTLGYQWTAAPRAAHG